MTSFMRRRHLAGERSLAFHSWIFYCTFPARESNGCALGFPRFTGKPKYFPKKSSVFIVKMDCTMLQWCPWALGESNMKDFCIFVMPHDVRHNSLMDWYRYWHCCRCTVVKNTSSAVNRRWLIGGLFSKFYSKACMVLLGLCGKV